MKGDFTRDTFHPESHYSRVLMQQGRVQLDADWNEQTSILLYYLRALAADLIGPHGGNGFAISAKDKDFAIGSGHYYVDGILCENESADRTYRAQPNYWMDASEERPDGMHLAYLDVWERHITYVQDGYICEKALNGPDTATRAQVVWQVKAFAVPAGSDLEGWLKTLVALRDKRERSPKDEEEMNALYQQLQEHLNTNLIQVSSATLRARVKPGATSDDPCILPPSAGYRGSENQLYRVEIHSGGDEKAATFKWSRDNGSVVFPIRSLSGGVATLDHLGRDDRHILKPDDWVEILNDQTALPGVLLQVDAVDPVEMTVTLNVPVGTSVPVYTEADASRHPLLRRWDQTDSEMIDLKDGAISVSANWIDLENGVQVQFQSGGTYRTGDYWLIPARTATGNVEWPTDANGGATPQPPHGVAHHYAPLAVITVDGSGTVTVADDLRRTITPIAV